MYKIRVRPYQPYNCSFKPLLFLLHHDEESLKFGCCQEGFRSSLMSELQFNQGSIFIVFPQTFFLTACIQPVLC